MISSGRWVIALSDHSSPLLSTSVQLMHIVQVILAISAPEHIDFVVVAISCVHIARSGWSTFDIQIQPPVSLQV
jgi:hypothetical protein